MDPREYRDARWHTLLRTAEDLGVEPEQAPTVVEQVLARQQARIRRAEDPDLLVRRALADAVLGPPDRPRSRRWPAVAALAIVVVAAGAVFALARPDAPPADHLRADQMPSLFGYDGAAASTLLKKRGLEVQQRPFRSCEVRDRVVASEPAAGAEISRGDHVVVYTALPADVSCLTDYAERQLAWEVLDWANGHGPAPSFAPRVWVYPSDGSAQLLTGAEAADPDSWRASHVLTALRRATADVALVQEHPLTYAVPALRIVAPTDGTNQCGEPDPSIGAKTNVVAFIIRSADRTGCPLRVELYRDRGERIESVALYPASS
ncbi:PASTA domain-containing protein [Nocardioides conyzicola]|uniref:PASTA domain-containing protein n=1 Tax=Nocardioides conyzicola TaxID=1651781 RepID=A0ABP8XHM8_9ACTN